MNTTKHLPVILTVVWMNCLAFFAVFFFTACQSEKEYIVSKDAPAALKLTDIAAGAAAQAQADNAVQPETPRKAAIAANLQQVVQVLGDPSKGSAKQAKVISDNALVGKLQDVQEALSKSNAQIAQLKAEKDKQQSDAEKKLQEEQEQARKVHNEFVSRWLQYGGLGCIAATVIFLAIYKLEGLSSVWPLPILAVGLFALADFVTSKWFWWGERIVGGLVVVAVGVYIYEEYRNKALVTNLQTVAAKVGDNLKNVDVGSLWARIVAWLKSLFAKGAIATPASQL